MTIWILAFVLLLALAGAGFRQGAIRVAFSLVGLLMAAALAMPLGRVLFPLLGKLGLKNPVAAAFLAPIVVFILILIIFKAVGLFVHKKVDVYYKYKAGDLRLMLWERLNHRLGFCLGLVNALVYLLLISVVIYTMSYWTVQMQTGDKSPFMVKLLNRLGDDLGKSGFVKAVRAVDPATEDYYKSADVVGIVYHNPLIYARLYRYPGFLALAERPELREVADNTDYTEMLQRQASLGEFIKHPKTKAILDNPQLLQDIWAAFKADIKDGDLQHYLESPTGESPKYDSEQILGRWVVDINATVNSLMKKFPANLPRAQMTQMRQAFSAAFSRMVFVAAPKGLAFFRGFPELKPGAPGNISVATGATQGTWSKAADDKYEITFSKDGQTDQKEAAISGEKLRIEDKQQGVTLTLVRED